jgi:hypothetical protein
MGSDRERKCEAGKVRTGRGSRRRAVKIAGGVVVAAIVVVVLAQLLLPGIAAEKVREKIGRYGTVKSVTVKAWPAVKLVWGEADEVQVRAGRLKLSKAQTVALVKEAKGVNRLDTSAESVEEGALRLTSTKLEKHGSALRVAGEVSEADVKRALPAGIEVALLKSEGGAVEAEDGKLVAQPTALLLSGLKLTVFQSPSVYVEGVEARARGRAAGEGARYELSMWASLR